MQNRFSQTRTKFVTTLGPASFDPAVIEGLILNGADILRNNFAHCKFDEYTERYKLLQELNQKHGTSVQIQADLQGPNIRIGTLADEGIDIEAGKEYVFYTTVAEPELSTDIPIRDNTLHLDLKVGELFTLMDGMVEGRVTWIKGNRIGVLIETPGHLISNKSVNAPESDLSTPPLTEKDYRDLEFLLNDAPGVDHIAISFIPDRKTLDEVRAKIGGKNIKIMSKVERLKAIDNIQEIVDASDSVMIARGDLGIEMPLETIPVLQRQIIDRCHLSKKPVITATQMLMSMANAKRPTRAEVSDVANAVFYGTDAVMLSEETAQGIDPVNALATMVRIVRVAEDYKYNRTNGFDLL